MPEERCVRCDVEKQSSAISHRGGRFRLCSGCVAMGYWLKARRGIWFVDFPEGGSVACAQLEGENKLARHQRAGQRREALHA